MRRLVGLPGDWITVPIGDGTTSSLQHVGDGQCWLEYDDELDLKDRELVDSRTSGTVPLALIEGIVDAVVWPHPCTLDRQPKDHRIRSKQTM